MSRATMWPKFSFKPRNLVLNQLVLSQSGENGCLHVI